LWNTSRFLISSRYDIICSQSFILFSLYMNSAMGKGSWSLQIIGNGRSEHNL
jgi:hypothetical protein